MTFLAITTHPTGRRCHLLGQRLHHGLVGLVLAVVGAVMVAHDWADRPWLGDA